MTRRQARWAGNIDLSTLRRVNSRRLVAASYREVIRRPTAADFILTPRDICLVEPTLASFDEKTVRATLRPSNLAEAKFRSDQVQTLLEGF